MSDQDFRDVLSICYALRDQPKLPEPRVLSHLNRAAKFPEDWERGKQMQRKLGLDAIPPNTECEMGAGWWNRVMQKGELP